MRILTSLLIAAGLLGLSACSDQAGAGKTDPRPNILLIIADDLGYSDLGVFGGEISTPNLDALAGAGRMLTNFHVAPTCSPTRAMLMSGTDAHRAGLGAMNGLWSEQQKGKPGYEGFLNKDIVTFVRLLKEAGYHTYMSGKWQLGYEDGYYPLDRGFEEAFWLKFGGASHFSDMRGITEYGEDAYWGEGREQLQALPDDFYSSDYFTDKMIEYIEKNRADGKPFFGYAAYTAPHWPLQAPQEYVDRYEGVYDAGYDGIREKRIERMRAAGLIGAGQTPAPQHPEWPGWEDLNEEQKKLEVRRMQLYAAMVEALDENIGRLIRYLKDSGEYENTFILFFSDNAQETVYTNGFIYTVNPEQPTAEALAVRDGMIVAVGSSDEVRAQVSDKARVMDLAGRMLMPGIHDMHAHPHSRHAGPVPAGREARRQFHRQTDPFSRAPHRGHDLPGRPGVDGEGPRDGGPRGTGHAGCRRSGAQGQRRLGHDARDLPCGTDPSG